MSTYNYNIIVGIVNIYAFLDISSKLLQGKLKVILLSCILTAIT